MGTRKKKISPIIKYAKQVLKDAIRRINNDECSEATVAYFLSNIDAESKNYFNDASFVNYDQAQRILGISNRNAMKLLCDKHNIKQHTINNQKVGFLRSDIEKLANDIKNGNIKTH